MPSARQAESPARNAGHRKTVAGLLVLATLIAALAIFSTWVNRQALNTDNWVATSDRLLQDDAVEARLSNYLAEQLFDNVDVQSELETTLPPRLAPLAGPAAGALHQLAPEVAERAFQSPRFEGLWSDANRRAHERLLEIVDGGGSTVSTDGGEVTLDLNALLTQVGGQVGGNLASKVPADAGKLTILESDQLSAAQDIVGLVRHLPVVLTLLAVLLYALAIYLAGPRRREALRGVGFSFAIAGVLILVLQRFGGGVVTDALAQSDSVEPAVDAVWSIGTSLLVTVAVSAISFGILLAIGAWLAGPTRLATGLRRDAAPYLQERVGATYAVVGLVFLALILWAPVVAFHKPIGLLVLAALMVIGTELLRRQAAAEFPDAGFGGLGDRVRGSIPGRIGAEQQAAAEPTKIDKIERLSDLKEKGALTAQEFESAKAEVIGTKES